jgi:membrane protease YdiL (CAAX protease family)
MGPTARPSRGPYLLTLLIVASIAAVNIASAGTGAAMPAVPPTVLEVFAELILAVLAVVLLTVLRSWRKVGFRRLSQLKDLRLYWVPLFPVLPAVAAAILSISRMRFEEIAFFLILAVLIGFVEEVLFRGLILQALAPMGLWRAAILSSILFGMMHLLNLFFGADLGATLLQTAYAAALGFGFAAVTLRAGALWPLIVIHTLIDFAGFLTREGTVMRGLTGTEVLIYIVYVVAFAAYGIFMMMGMTRRAAPGDHLRTPAGMHS